MNELYLQEELKRLIEKNGIMSVLEYLGLACVSLVSEGGTLINSPKLLTAVEQKICEMESTVMTKEVFDDCQAHMLKGVDSLLSQAI